MKIQFLGHAGFRLSFQDPNDQSIERVIYIDTWCDNPKFPESMKGKCNDADIVLVTHGHFDHSGSVHTIALDSIANGKNTQVFCVFEIMHHLNKTTELTDANITPGNKGSPLDFGFCKIVMVTADHSSGCPGTEEHDVVYGGDPIGYVIEADGIRVYHAGDTNVFTDMTIISELYKPNYALLPIGGRFTMGPREAAYAISKFLKSVEVVIAMHYDTFPLLTGRPEQLVEALEEFKDFREKDPKVIVPYDFHEEQGTLSYHE